MTIPQPSPMRSLFRRPNGLGLTLGTILSCLTFGPSLLPRTWLTQACLNALVFALGYAVGSLLSRTPIVAKVRLGPKAQGIGYGVLALCYGLAATLGQQWQQASRLLISLPPNPDFWAIPSVLGSVGLALVIVLWGRLVAGIFSRFGLPLVRRMPMAVRLAMVVLALGVLMVGPFRRALYYRVADHINEVYGSENKTTEPGLEQPSQPQVSGSPESLISWSSLGLKGRTFVATAPSVAVLESFHGVPGQVPIRIYAGLDSAPTVQQRAELAVADLLRAGGFERAVLVVITTTGTGWVDENGPVPMEYLANGDSALIAMQYSYLPSVFSFLADSHKAREAGRALYDAVYLEWSRLPEDQRPLLLSFGESLGSYGAEAAFPSAQAFRERCQGALLVGPPNVNPIRTEAVAHRDPGSSEVLPIVEEGRTVRFAWKASDLDLPRGQWEYPRAVYLQNPSDPIVWWSPKLMFHKPDWLREKRGGDVLQAMTWFPIITFLQTSTDYLQARAPDGHGHRYGTLPVDAWVKIASPEGWSDQDTERLKAFLEEKKAL